METFNILLLEDDREYNALVRQMLEKAPGVVFNIMEAPRLQTAFHLLEAHKPDLILADLDLPDSRGLDTLLGLRRLFKDGPIILSAGGDEETALEAVRKGAQDYLVKGHLDARHLLRVLRYALERHRILNELHAAGRALERLVTVDPLTGLLNRCGFEQTLKEEIAYLKRRGETAFALLLDMDDFKHVNESFGHSAGDILLKEIAAKIEGALRATHVVARIGGNEFAVLLSDTREAEALHVAEKIRLVLSQSPVAISEGRNVFVSCSLGLAELEPQTSSLEELLQILRVSLSRSKKNGKNQLSVYQTGMWPSATTAVLPSATTAALPSATTAVRPVVGSLETDSLALLIEQLALARNYYAVVQPIIQLETGERTGGELFSRFSHPEFGQPDDFFRLAREARLLALIDRLCLRTCLKQAAEARLEGQLHVNLFPSTLIDIPVSQLLEEFAVAENRPPLCIEISEQQVLSEPSHLLEAVRTLRQAGLSVAVDDVGFGRSCLESLIVLEPNVIKIDKRCVSGIDRDPVKQKLFKRLLGVIRSLEAEVIAEGIETQGELEFIIATGIRYGQGYFFSRPVPVLEPASLF